MKLPSSRYSFSPQFPQAARNVKGRPGSNSERAPQFGQRLPSPRPTICTRVTLGFIKISVGSFSTQATSSTHARAARQKRAPASANTVGASTP